MATVARVLGARPQRQGVRGAATATALRLAVRLARDDGWSSDGAGRRLAHEVADPSIIRAARARVVQASVSGELLPTMRRVLESFDRALGVLSAGTSSDRGLVAS